MSETWNQVCTVDEFPTEGKLAVAVGDWQILLLKEGSDFFAYNDCCTHQAARLSSGKVKRGAIMCPLHGARFKIANGECIGGSYGNLRGFPTMVEDGVVLVSVPEEAPGPAERPQII